MAEQMNGTHNAGRITVRSDLHSFMEQIDQYTAQLPLTIREQMRQALYREYDSDYTAQEELCREMLETVPGNADVLSMLGRCLMAQGRAGEAQEYLEQAQLRIPITSIPRSASDRHTSRRRNTGTQCGYSKRSIRLQTIIPSISRLTGTVWRNWGSSGRPGIPSEKK